jgi:hypothetical protein
VHPSLSPEQELLMSLFGHFQIALKRLDNAFESLDGMAEMGLALEAVKQVR